MDDNIKYCLCTEGCDKSFAYLRVMLLSFLKNNRWFNGEIKIFTCDLTPLSSDNRKILTSLYDNISYVDIDPKKYSHLDLRKLDDIGKTSLYRLSIFSITGFDFMLYINHCTLCIKDISNAMFVGNSDVVSPMYSDIRRTRPAKNSKKSKHRKQVYNPLINSDLMLISRDVTTEKIRKALYEELESNSRKIKGYSINSIINTVFYKNNVSTNVLASSVLIKKSMFPDSKLKNTYTAFSNVGLITLDIGINDKIKTTSIFRYKKINRLWLDYNSSDLYEKISIELDKRIRVHKARKDQSEERRRLAEARRKGKIYSRKRRVIYIPPLESYPMPGKSLIVNLTSSNINGFESMLSTGGFDEIQDGKFEILIGINRKSKLLSRIKIIESKNENVHVFLMKSNGHKIILNTLFHQCLYHENVLIIDKDLKLTNYVAHENSTITSFEALNKLKIGILTAAYKRKELTSHYCKHLSYLQEIFKNEIDMTSVVVDSYRINEKAVIENNQIYFSRRNKPVSNKFNYGMNYFANKKIDGVIILGSDNFMCDNLLKKYIKVIRNKYDLTGVLDSKVYDSITDKTYYFKGYTNKRHGETLGAGRMISSKLLESLKYTPWDNGLNKGLDGSMWKKIKQFDINEYKILTNINGFLMLGVKTDIFISNVNKMKNKVIIDKTILKKIPCLNEYL